MRVRSLLLTSDDRKVISKDLTPIISCKCQICGFTFKQKNGNFYSEVAHIIPISGKSAGADSPENMAVLCPNHHKMLDMGNLEIVSKTEYSIEGEVGKFLQELISFE